MRLARYVPLSVRTQMKDLRHNVELIRQSISNARKAFVPTEHGYRLNHCDLARGFDLDALSARLRSTGFELEFRNQTLSRGWIIATR